MTTQTTDGLKNVLAKIGASMDVGNIFGQSTYEDEFLRRDRQQLESMYASDWLCGAIIDTIADDMTREGVEFISGLDDGESDRLDKSMVSLGVWDSLNQLIKMARLYGGAVGVIIIDGAKLDSPLLYDRLTPNQFTGIVTYDRHDVTALTDDLIQTGRDFGLPTYYNINMSSQLMVKVHHSRIIRQIGVTLPRRLAIQESLWGDSVLARAKQAVNSYNMACGGAANLVHKAHLVSVAIKDLRERMTIPGGEEELMNELMFAARAHTQEGRLVHDADDVVSYHSPSFTGLVDIIGQFERHASGAAKIPITKLFGQSPAGMNATGDSDTRMYYDTVLSEQESRLRSGVDKILQVMHRTVLGRPTADDFNFEFIPLWQMNETEKSVIGKTVADTIAVLSGQGIISDQRALQELRASSASTGLFSGITDQEIAEAASPPPPEAGLEEIGG